MKKHRLNKILFLIFILAFFLRFLAVVMQDDTGKALGADAKQYDNIAVNIISGNGFSQVVDGPKVPTAYRTPTFPLFLAFIYYIFGHNYIAAKMAQALLGAFFCLLIFFITNAIYKNETISLIASLITVLYRPFISGFSYYGGPGSLLSEYLYMFIMGAAVLSIVIFMKGGNRKFGILSGIFIGLTILTRPDFALFPFILFIYLFFYTYRFSLKKFIKKYFILYLFIFLAVLPWIARNYVAFGKFIPLSTHGDTLWLGNNSLARGAWSYPENYIATMDQIKNLPEYEQNKILFKNGLEYLKNNPKRAFALIPRKIVIHWIPFEEKFKMFNPYYAAVLLLAGIGILFFRIKQPGEHILFLVLLTTTLISVIMLGEPRFRYPYEPYLIIFASLTVNRIFIALRPSLNSRLRGESDSRLRGA